MDPNQLMNTVLDFAGTVALGLFGLAITKITSWIKTWFAKKTVQDAVNSAAGSVLLKLASGAIGIGDVNATHPALTKLADAALARVPDAAAVVGGVSPESMAALVVGAVGRAISADPSVPTVPTLALLPHAPVL